MSNNENRTEDNNTDTAEIATATESLGQAPSSPVAFTGANSLRLAVGAMMLILGGVALVALRRRRLGNR